MASTNRYFHAQHGLITLQQAKEAGISRRHVQGLVGKGLWTPVRPGIYRNTAVAPRWEARVLAQVLGRRALASHRTAAALWNLEEFNEPRPEITVPYGTSQACDVTIHQTSHWELRDQCKRRGIETTGVNRTLTDCAAVTSISVVERMAESAIRQRLTSWEQLAHVVDAHRACGRNGSIAMQRLLSRRFGDAAIPRSGFSRRVSQLLQKHRINEPRVEFAVVDGRGNHILYLDLAWPTQRKAIELDGLRWHFGRVESESDKDKRNRCKAEGWRILEVTWAKFVDDPDGVVDVVTRFLDS